MDPNDERLVYVVAAAGVETRRTRAAGERVTQVSDRPERPRPDVLGARTS